MVRPKTYTEDLRTALIDGAAEIVAARGLDGLSLRTLAADHGTSTNAIYAMFGGKSGLVATVMQKAARGFAAAQAAAVRGEDVYTDLRELGLAYRAWAIGNPALYTVMFGGRTNDEEHAAVLCAPESGVADAEPLPAGVLHDGQLPLFEVVSRGIAQGLLVDAPVPAVVTSIWASVHGHVSLEIAPWSGLPRGDEGDALYRMHIDSIARAWVRPGVDFGPIRGRHETSVSAP